jgi:hypothetical protein
MENFLLKELETLAKYVAVEQLAEKAFSVSGTQVFVTVYPLRDPC